MFDGHQRRRAIDVDLSGKCGDVYHRALDETR